jgi:hypothetical protein
VNSIQRSFNRRDLNRKTTIQVCIACNKPIEGKVVWVKKGTIVKYKRPYHEGCK